MDRRAVIRAFAGVASLGLLRSAPAQTAAKYRLGYLNPNSSALAPRTLDLLVEGLKALGFARGADYDVQERWTGGNPDRLRSAADELAAAKPAVIVASSTQAAVAAARATRTIPIVFVNVSNPVDAGLVKSLRQPGGNATGITSLGDQLMSKLLELSLALVPSPERIGVFVNPDDSTTRQHLRNLDAAAKARDLRYGTHELARVSDIARAFAELARAGKDALVVVTPQPLFFGAAGELAAGSLAARIPLVSPYRQLTEAGGLASYGSDIAANHRRAAGHVAKILKGADPAQLPVEQPTEYELVLNRRSAGVLGVAIPNELLLRADAVIE